MNQHSPLENRLEDADELLGHRICHRRGLSVTLRLLEDCNKSLGQSGMAADKVEKKITRNL